MGGEADQVRVLELFDVLSILLLIAVKRNFAVLAVDTSLPPSAPQLSCDSADAFICSSDPLECIPEVNVCNGVSECTNGFDESVAACGCLPHEFKCNDTSCIDAIKLCDRHEDCDNGLDEEDCAVYLCPETHSKCANHYCVPNDAVCNYTDDCGDNSDEENCAYRPCYSTEFPCRNQMCLPIGLLCDGEANCLDGSDEDHCEEHFRCENGLYVYKDRVCDGWPDCYETHADETDCGECTEGQFRCKNGRCVRNSNVCDGVCDCLYTCEDERICDSLECPLGENYICKNSHRCIAKEYLCDGLNDCWNTFSGADEYFCYKNESECDESWEKSFICPEGRCLPASGHDNVVCDHYADCLNGEDEVGCDYKACNGSQFRCKNGQCIPWEKRCNGGTPDCYDRSDETGCESLSCPYGTTKCKSGQCIPQQYWCDYVRDCPDFSDEDDCLRRRCHADEYTCANGQCIDRKYVCYNGKRAGRNGCADGSHLLNCKEVKQRSGINTINLLHPPKAPKGKKHKHESTRPLWKPKQRKAKRTVPFPQNGLMAIENEENQMIHTLSNKQKHQSATTEEPPGNGNWTCAKDQFKCHLSYCIETSQVCDGVIDCKMTYVDEFSCNFRCPVPELTCECNDITMTCENKGLTRLPYDLTKEDVTKYYLGGNHINLTETTFHALSELTHIDLNSNEIVSLNKGTFRSLWRLHSLNLEKNSIDIIGSGVFEGLSNLRNIFLGDNNIREIQSHGFVGLSQLLALNLSYQAVIKLQRNAFIGLKNLRNLDLSHNKISVIEEGSFNGLISLLKLDLSKNRIQRIDNNVFHGLKQLTDLDVSSNVIKVIEENVFHGLGNLSTLKTDEFRFCCAARISGRCTPEPDEFSSCTDLMSNYVLRVSIWVLGLLAFWGNIIVIVWRTRDLRNGKVHSFLITNLAIGDFFMGAYMLIIAVVDSYYRGNYILYDKVWRESDLCKFAGFISTFSSELSVLTLTVITLDRLICIIFPLKMKQIKLKQAVFVMSLLWLSVLAISAIPLVGIHYFENFYGRSGVCLAFHITNAKPKGWEYSVGVFLVLNFFSFLIIFFSYLRMFFVAKQTRSAVRKTESRSDSAMARRMTVIVMTDFFCWVPIILLGFASLGGAHVPSQVYAWVAVFILPLNSAVNPIIYTISTAPFLRNFRKRASKFRKSFTGSKNDTKNSFLEDRSSHIWDRKPIYRHLELMRMRSLNNKPYTAGHSQVSNADI